MARIPLAKRLIIGVCNIIFPPIAVMLLTGLNEDVLINSLLFLLAVIPSHIHGFYISLTYFNRKRKVRQGVYPGDKHSFIWSEKVNNGGASRREMQKLKDERDYGKYEDKDERPGLNRKLSERVENWDDGFGEHVAALSGQNSMSRQTSTTQRPGLSQRTSMTQRPDFSRQSSSTTQAQRPQLSRQNSRQPRSPQQPQQLTNGSHPTSTKSRSRSRSRSLTRQAITGLERQVSRRLAAREERRRRREEAEEVEDDETGYVESVVPVGQEVRRWR